MTFLLLLAFAVAVVMLQRQNNRLLQLEYDVKLLRARLDEAGVEALPEADAQAPGAERVEAFGPATGPALEPAAAPAPPRPPFAAPVGWRPKARLVEEAAPAPNAPGTAPEAATAGPRDLVASLGSRWAVWVGGLALALGGLFLVRYSLEAGLLGPRVRLALAALLGLALAGGAEVVRRGGLLTTRVGASIPAVLAAAAAFVLFGTVYAAHGLYGFLGPGTGFALMGLVGLGTILAAPRYGAAVAGLGLLGADLTPALVSSQAAAPAILFAYLAVVLVAALAVAAQARWVSIASGAIGGAGLWSLAYLFLADTAADPVPVVLLQGTGIAALAALWLGRMRAEATPNAARMLATLSGLFAAAVSVMLVRLLPDVSHALPLGVLLPAVMMVAAAWRGAPALPLLHAAGGTALILNLWDTVAETTLLPGAGTVLFQIPDAAIARQALFAPFGFALALFTLALGLVLALRAAGEGRREGLGWAIWAALLPLSAIAATWLLQGDVGIDLRFGAASLALALVLAASAELAGRRERPEPQRGGPVVSALAGGAASALALALPMVTDPLGTVIATGACALVPALLTRRRVWPVLGWLASGFAAVVLARVALDPTVVGRAALSATPVLNALLPAYLLPALSFGLAAWQLGRTTRGRPQQVLQAFSALFALLGAAMLVRHAMNGGVIDASEPRLAEQAIYTLILTGGGTILLLLDRQAPSPVWRWGSLALGTLSVLSVAIGHLGLLNPLFTDEVLGANPVFDLLLLAYALPTLALGALALTADGRRPPPFVALVATVAGLMALAFVTLRIRRLFHGERIGLFWGIGDWETYSFSAAWLVIGVLLLLAGLRWPSRALRSASAALVVLAVAKVFLFDMRHLGGVLRPLSFIGLGAVLIGIGLLYQRMLARTARTERPAG